MSQPTHLTLALGRPRNGNNDNDDGTPATPELSLTVTYRLDPGETDLNAVIVAHADELRAAFLTLYAHLRLPAGPRPSSDPNEHADDEEALEEWQDGDAPDDDGDLTDPGEDDRDGPDDRPPPFLDNTLPVPSTNGHGAAMTDTPPTAEPSSRVQQIAARSAAWRAGLSADDLTLLLAQHFGKVRVEQLDKAEAEAFLKALQRKEVAARTVALN